MPSPTLGPIHVGRFKPSPGKWYCHYNQISFHLNILDVFLIHLQRRMNGSIM